MELKPLDSPELFRLVTDWLAEKANYQWLDFGNGTQIVTPTALKVMTQRDIHVLRVFTADDGVPIGVVGLSNVNRHFKTATLWVVLGNKKYSGQGYPFRACSKILSFGFKELGLNAVNAWAVENNYASIRRIIQRLNFRLIGRQRQCHYIDGRFYDRLHFDLLAHEHQETAAIAPREEHKPWNSYPSMAQG